MTDEMSDAWYLDPRWQAGEQEASRDIAEGRTTRHESVDALFDHLNGEADPGTTV